MEKPENGKDDYTTVSFPAPLLRRVDAFVSMYPFLGYTNKSAYVTAKARTGLEEDERHLLNMARLYEKDGTLPAPFDKLLDLYAKKGKDLPPPFDRPWPRRKARQE